MMPPALKSQKIISQSNECCNILSFVTISCKIIRILRRRVVLEDMFLSKPCGEMHYCNTNILRVHVLQMLKSL